MRRLKLIVVLGGVIALLARVGVAWATTGATTGYPQPQATSSPRRPRPRSKTATC